MAKYQKIHHKQRLTELFHDDNDNDKIRYEPIPIAIILFNTPKIVSKVLEDFKNSNSLIKNKIEKNEDENSKYIDNKIKITKIGSPSGINFENFSDPWRKWYNAGKITIIGIISLAIFNSFFLICYLIKKIQKDQISPDSSILKILVLLFIALMIFTMQEILFKLYKKMSSWPRFESIELSELTYSLIRGIQILHCQIVFPMILYSEKEEWSLTGNLIDYVWMNFVVSTVSQLLAPFNFEYLLKVYQRHKLRNTPDEKQIHTQDEAKKIFTPQEFNCAQHYSNLFGLILTSIFFCPLFPLGIIFTTIGLFIQYWIQKYLMMNRYCTPKYKSARIGTIYTYFIFIVSTVIFLTSNILFYEFYGENVWTTFLIIFITFYFIFSFKFVHHMNLREDSEEKEKTSCMKKLEDRLYELLTFSKYQPDDNSEYWEAPYDLFKLGFGTEIYGFKIPIEAMEAEMEMLDDIGNYVMKDTSSFIQEKKAEVFSRPPQSRFKEAATRPKEKIYKQDRQIIPIPIQPPESEQEPEIEEVNHSDQIPQSEEEKKEANDEAPIPQPRKYCRFKCDGYFTNQEFDFHLEKICPFAIKCDLCKKGVYLTKLNQHRINEHPDEYRKCSICDLALHQRNGYKTCYKCRKQQKINKKTRSNKTRKIVCPLCVGELKGSLVSNKMHFSTLCPYNKRTSMGKKFEKAHPDLKPNIYFNPYDQI